MSALTNPVFESEGKPLWQSVYNALTPGANLNLSTLTIPLNGSINMTGTDTDCAPIVFTQDPLPSEQIIRKELIDTYTNTQLKTLGVFIPDAEIGAPWTAQELYLTGDQNTLLGNNTIASFIADPDDEFGLLIGSGSRVRIDCLTNISTLQVSTINGQPWDPDFGVSKLIAGSNITLNPPSGTGNVTISARGASTFQQIFTSSIAGNTARFSTINASSITGVNFNFSTINTGTATMNSTITSYISSGFGTFGTVAGGLISTSITTATQAILSSLQFNFNAGGFNPNLGGVNLGLGGFLGGLVGGIGSGIFNTILGGAALTTGIIALTNSRGNAPLNSNLYEMVNTTTQLQISTLGISTLTFQRLSVPVPGALFSTFGREVIISTILPAGTVAIRSYSDPVNLAAPSSVTSTVQAFAPWAALPSLSNQGAVSISSLTVSSINGQPYTPGGGGSSSFDPNSISTIMQWYQFEAEPSGSAPFNAALFVNVQPSSFSTSYFEFLSGDPTGTVPGKSDDVDGIVNFNLGSNMNGNAFARILTGDVCLGSRWTGYNAQLNNTVRIQNNFSSIQNPSGVAQIELARISTNPITVGGGNVLGYADLIAGDFYASTNGVGLGGGGVFAQSISTTNIAIDGVVTTNLIVQSNAIGQAGQIIATQCAPSASCNINYHNIGGCLLGYYGTGSAYMSGGFQTSINTLVFNGGCKMSNGYVFASPSPGVPDSYLGGCWFRQNGYATGMMRTAYDVFSNQSPGQTSPSFCKIDRACIVRGMISAEPGNSSYYTAFTAYIQNWNAGGGQLLGYINIDAGSGGGANFGVSFITNPDTYLQFQITNNTGVGSYTYSCGYQVFAFTGAPVI